MQLHAYARNAGAFQANPAERDLPRTQSNPFHMDRACPPTTQPMSAGHALSRRGARQVPRRPDLRGAGLPRSRGGAGARQRRRTSPIRLTFVYPDQIRRGRAVLHPRAGARARNLRHPSRPRPLIRSLSISRASSPNWRIGHLHSLATRCNSCSVRRPHCCTLPTPDAGPVFAHHSFGHLHANLSGSICRNACLHRRSQSSRPW